jgi:hypothetical protein
MGQFRNLGTTMTNRKFESEADVDINCYEKLKHEVVRVLTVSVFNFPKWPVNHGGRKGFCKS